MTLYRITEPVRRISIRLAHEDRYDPREQAVLPKDPDPPLDVLSARQAQRQERFAGITKMLQTFAVDDPEGWLDIYQRWLS